jgi:hypothetical protein
MYVDFYISAVSAWTLMLYLMLHGSDCVHQVMVVTCGVCGRYKDCSKIVVWQMLKYNVACSLQQARALKDVVEAQVEASRHRLAV